MPAALRSLPCHPVLEPAGRNQSASDSSALPCRGTITVPLANERGILGRDQTSAAACVPGAPEQVRSPLPFAFQCGARRARGEHRDVRLDKELADAGRTGLSECREANLLATQPCRCAATGSRPGRLRACTPSWTSRRPHAARVRDGTAGSAEADENSESDVLSGGAGEPASYCAEERSKMILAQRATPSLRANSWQLAGSPGSSGCGNERPDVRARGHRTLRYRARCCRPARHR